MSNEINRNTESTLSEILIVLKKLREQQVDILSNLKDIKSELRPSGGESASTLDILQEMLEPIARDISKIGLNIEIDVESKELFSNESKSKNTNNENQVLNTSENDEIVFGDYNVNGDYNTNNEKPNDKKDYISDDEEKLF